MRQLVRAYCKVCLEMTTWEANENGLVQCLDAEHLQVVKAARDYKNTVLKKTVPKTPLVNQGTANS